MIPVSEFSYWLCIETMWLLKKKSFKDNIWTLSDSIIVINSDMHTFFFLVDDYSCVVQAGSNTGAR